MARAPAEVAGDSEFVVYYLGASSSHEVIGSHAPPSSVTSDLVNPLFRENR